MYHSISSISVAAGLDFGPWTVTWRDRVTELTVGFRSIAGARSRPSLPGLSPSGRCPMTTAALVPIQPVLTDAERLALAGFLAGYRGPGRAHPGVRRPRLPSGPAGSIGPAIMGRHR